MIKRAILYARVSTHNQTDNTSLDYQIEQCRAYAQSHGYEVVREFRETQSGAKSDRTELNKAREMRHTRQADCIIVYKMDRFMRGDDAKSDPGIDAAITERELNRVGLEVIFLDLPAKDSDAYAWIKAIKRIVASVERESIRSRFENGKNAALSNGKPAHGGRCPLGYKRNDAGYFEIVESEASAIRLIFDLYVGGMNVPSIVDYLRDNNVPGYRNSKGTWGDWIVYDVLRREAYHGRYAIVKTRSVKDETRANGYRPEKLPKDEWIYVDVPAIVTKDVWNKAQKITEKRVNKPKRAKVYYLLSGRVTCECGYAMAGNSAKRVRKDGTSVRTRYYLCKGKSNRYALRPCKARAIRADKLEEMVYRWVDKVISDPDFLKQLYEKTQANRKSNTDEQQERLDAILEEKHRAERRLRRLTRRSFDLSDLELAEYKPEIEKLRNAIEYQGMLQTTIERDLQQAENDDKEFDDLLQYIADARKAISFKRQDRDFQEKAVRAIDLHVTVSLDQQTVTVSCVMGEDVLSLYDVEDSQTMESVKNVLEFSVSRTQYTDQTPSPPGPRHAPIPG